MSAACQMLDADALVMDAADGRVADHLAGCADCRQRRTALLRIAGELKREDRVPSPRHGWENRVLEQLDGKRVVPERESGWPVRRWVLAFTAPVLALAAVVVLLKLPGDVQAPEAVFAALERRPRTQPWRLSSPLADRHRPRETYRGVGDAPAPGLGVNLEPLERAGDSHLLAAAQLLAGMREQAEAKLAALPQSADVLNDRAAVLLDRGKPAEALAVLERARGLAPQHPQATWNTAVALRALGRPGEALDWFERAARSGPPDWAAEARAEAAALRTPAP